MTLLDELQMRVDQLAVAGFRLEGVLIPRDRYADFLRLTSGLPLFNAVSALPHDDDADDFCFFVSPKKVSA